jgi:hypothetical protein
MAKERENASFDDSEGLNDDLWEFSGLNDDIIEIEEEDDFSHAQKPPVFNTDDKKPEPPKEEEAEEEEEEAGEEEEENEEEEESGEQDTDESPAQYFAKLFAEKGLLTIPEGLDIKDDEDLDKVIEFTIKEGIDQYKASLSEEALKIVEFVENGGAIEDYVSVAQAIPSFENLDISDESNQKELYRQYLTETTKFSEAKINKLVEQADEDLELEDNATEAQAYFKEKAAKAKESLVLEQKARNERSIKDREAFIDTTKALIEKETEIYDYPLGDAKKRKELMDYILKPTVPFETADGRKILITQMQADKHELSQDKDRQYKTFIFEALQLKNKFNLEPVKKKGVTENNSKLKALAEKHKTRSTQGNLSTTGNKSANRPKGKLLFETD